MKVILVLAAVVAACVALPPPGWRPSGRALLIPSRVQEEPSTSTAPQPNNTQSDEKESERVLDSGEYYVLLEDGKLQMVKYTTAALKEQDDKPDSNGNSVQPQQKPQQTQQYQQAKPQYPFYVQVQQPQKTQQYQQEKPQYPYYVQVQQPQQTQQYQQEKPQYPYYVQVQQPQQKPQQTQQSSQQYRSSPAASNPQPFAQFQVEYFQFPQPGAQFAPSNQQYTAPEADAESDVEEEESDAKESTGFESKVQYRDVKPISAPIYAYNPTPLVRILKK